MGNLKGRNHLEYLGIDGRIILNNNKMDIKWNED
jgi:hypothetical protein